MKSPSKRALYLILAVNVFLLAVVALLLWQIEEEKVDLAVSIKESSLTKTAGEKLLAGSWTKLETQLSALDNYFLSASTTVEFLERLEKTATLTKTTLKINQASAEGDLKINFSIQGSFLAVSQFLIGLENFPYALRIERLDLRSLDKSLWRGDFVIKVMAQK